MKIKRKLSIFAILLIAVTVVTLSSTKCFAAVQYTGNVIPAMTSDTAPSGVASASSVWSASYHAYNAFDHDVSNVYHAWASSTVASWLEYDFPNPKCITKYTIASRNTSVSELPKDWTFEAWDEQGQNWIVLDTQSNITTWSLLVKKEFAINNTNNYSKYRINITANNGQTYTCIGELEMMETGTMSIPSNLVATAGDAKVDLVWDAVTGATNYNIKRSLTAGGPYVTIANATTAKYADLNLTNGTTYYYVVSAIDASGESANSIEVSAIPNVPAVSLKLVLEVNQEQQLSVYDDLLENINMTWTSSNAQVATVDANGVAKALKVGNTIITCTSSDGSYTESIKIIVVKTIQLAVDLYVGKTCRLTVDDLANTTKVTWVSGDTSVATISSTGKVTAVSSGLTLITAFDDQGIEIGHVYIRVRI